MDSKNLGLKVGLIALDMKGYRVRLYDLRGFSAYSDFAIVISATSIKHSKAISDKVYRKLKQEDKTIPLGVEGEDTGEWILLDYDDIIVHIFTDDSRMYYDLDSLWKELPAETINDSMKMGE